LLWHFILFLLACSLCINFILLCIGLIKSVGVSNYTREHLEELLQYCRIKPAVLQVMHILISYRNRLSVETFKNLLLLHWNRLDQIVTEQQDIFIWYFLGFWLDRDCHLPTSTIQSAFVDVLFTVLHWPKKINLNCNQLLYILW